MKKTALYFFLIFPFTCLASNATDEINHLLNYVANTDCMYERNGILHTGKDALVHIKKKYDNFKNDIHSAEDFINYSATKSIISGKEYRIICQGKPIQNSKDWLTNELRIYRSVK